MPVRRAHFLIVPLNAHGWGIRVRDTVYGQFATHDAASEHAIQWGRRMVAKGVEVRVLVATNGGHPQVVWTSELRDSLAGGEVGPAPSKDVQVR